MLLEGLLGPGGDHRRGCHENDRKAVIGQFLRDRATQVVAIVIEHDDRGRRRGPGEEVVGREHMRGIAARNRCRRLRAADAVLAPAGTGGDGDVLITRFEHRLGRHLALAEDLD